MFSARLSVDLTLSCAIAEQVNLPSQFDRPPEMDDLLNMVAAKAKSSWEQVAVQLKISLGDIDSIRNAKMADNNSCYTEVLKVWQRRESLPIHGLP